MRKPVVSLAAYMRALVPIVAAVFLMAPLVVGAEPQDEGTNKAESVEKAANAGQAGEQVDESQPATKKININKATAKELESLPGIGPALSKRIIEGRPYEKIEDIQKVKGIGPKTFEKIKDKITVK